MRARLFWLGLPFAACATECDQEDYPLDPTFCDDWCHVLLRPGCDQEPENCVRNCERSLAVGECFPLQEALLDCYHATPASEFTCSGQGFQATARPDELVCPSERDALIECAYPDVLACLNRCRDLEMEHTGDAGDAGDAGDGTTGASGNTCPAYDMPCDSMCWAGRFYLDDVPPDAGTTSALTELVLNCAIERAETCRSQTGAELEDANWASVLGDCVDALGL